MGEFMALYVGSTKIGTTAYCNSQKLKKMKLNTTDVWQGLPEIYNTLKNSTSAITQAQWLEFLNTGCVALVIENNDQANFRNKTITLENTAVSAYKIWTIADFNHDNTSNTVDVIQTKTIYNSIFNSSGHTYNGSTIRNWLINSYLPYFNADIKNKMQTMLVETYTGNTNDKIKILSGKECYNLTSYSEGAFYPIFLSDNSRKRSGTSANWWLRTIYQDGSNNSVFYINNIGEIKGARTSTSYGVMPCIRFA